ncbi:uncharacterized protein LOC108739181 [Agrilus planipennis]|uniref:Uncharacterized protein LOC108739181 n=1 Tax=Agrilus planipennis TaxID=224129 RepID=A0A1W4X6K1_AGRPL|nr:uncharacterized protein LOC108739181 [Agrilus planipennis]
MFYVKNIKIKNKFHDSLQSLTLFVNCSIHQNGLIIQIIMSAFHLIRNTVKNINILHNIRKYSSQNYHTIFNTEFSVIPFCHLNIQGGFHLNIIPLDVHKYINADKVFVNFISPDPKNIDIPECKLDNDVITITSNNCSDCTELICNIEAPVKANVQATVSTGNIHISNFQGDHVLLGTKSGDISVENCYCQKIELHSEAGNIICKKVLQASDTSLTTGNFGSITANKLQGINLIASTVNGHIRTESTYFKDSFFSSETGPLHLLNAHKNCKVHIKSKGELNLIRFDGVLEAILKEGKANIQLSRIEADSKIIVDEEGELNLKLFESCQQTISLKIVGQDIRLNDNLQMTLLKENDNLILTGENTNGPKLNITAPKSKINVEGATISDLFSKSL